MDFKQVFEYTRFLSILYVEDEELILEHTCEIFYSFFHNVTKALDGQEGIDKYIDHKKETGKFFDIVITDIQMPNKNGLEMISEIRELNKEQSIIVTSAHNESSLLINLIQQGISNFILKPFVNKQLLNVLYETAKNIHIKKENIRLEIEKQIQIEQKNTQHHKMLAMADMIDNIAHQYRQPLTIISTTATSMRVDKELGVFKENELIENCIRINENVQYLSSVIDDFKELINDDKKREFNIYELLDDLLTKQSRIIKENDVNIIFNYDNELTLNSHPNLLVQAFLNILLNAIDVLITMDHPRYIFIDILKEDDNYIIIIKDNGGGIKDDIITKVFDIYFSTKHKYIGTGLGLYVTYNIMTRQLGGEIEVTNETFNFEQKEYSGASFKLSFPSE